MTRAIIADPDLPNKLRAGQRVRPCIGINQGCIGRLYSGYPIVCSVNPAIRDPQLDVLELTERPRRVVVVGGGVAGMEAARHAARRGHQVTLLERGDQLGGRSLLNATHGWRPSWHRYLDYLSAELQSLGVTVICGVEATAAEVLSHDPETVVVATGSQLRDRLGAADGPHAGRCRRGDRSIHPSPATTPKPSSSTTTAIWSRPPRSMRWPSRLARDRRHLTADAGR